MECIVKQLKTLLSLITLLAVLVSCAPTITANSSYSPLYLDASKSVELTSGATWYIAAEYSPEEIGYSLADLDGAMRLKMIGRLPIGKVLNTNISPPKIKTTNVGDEWKFSITKAEVKRKIVDNQYTQQQRIIYYNDSVTLVLSVTPPTQTLNSHVPILAMIEGKDGKDYPIFFKIKVMD
jgi:hypothetical protein